MTAAAAGSPTKLAHLVFKTPRMEAMIAWYCRVLGAEVVFRSKRIAFLTYDDEHHRVAFVRVPRPLRVPAVVWALHRKVFGFDHAAFTYDSLPELAATYRRLAASGIDPVWCINHGPTTSMYYQDPDGNRIELQVDNFGSNDELLDWMRSGEFDRNPIGVEFDPDVLERLLVDGADPAALSERGSAPPDGLTPRSGMRAIRWTTL